MRGGERVITTCLREGRSLIRPLSESIDEGSLLGELFLTREKRTIQEAVLHERRSENARMCFSTSRHKAFSQGAKSSGLR